MLDGDSAFRLGQLYGYFKHDAWVAKGGLGGTYFQLQFDRVWITVEPRPPHCTRGRFYAKCDSGNPLIEVSLMNNFPRYYMDLNVAMTEMRAWICNLIFVAMKEVSTDERTRTEHG